LRDHGWFVFFAPRDNPQIAGVVFAEHAEHGANAAPIAKHAMETFFAKKDGQPLPPPLPVLGKPQPAPAEGGDDPTPSSTPAAATVAVNRGSEGLQGSDGAQGAANLSNAATPANRVNRANPGNPANR
jgi:hypothetical protein